MGKAEDRARAERARERGKAERAEVEEEASRTARTAEYRRKEIAWRLAASCHRLAWFGSEDFVITGGVLAILAVGTEGMLWFEGDLSDRSVLLTVSCVTIGVLLGAALLWRVVRASVFAGWNVEAQWLAALPFTVTGIDDGLASTSSQNRLRVRVTFRGANHGQAERARQMLVHVDPGGSATSHSDHVELTARVAGEPSSDGARVRGRRLLFHDLVDGVLLPLHADTPIARVVLDD